MSKSIIEKKAQVIVVDSRVDTRVIVRDALKQLGFYDIIIVASVEECLNTIGKMSEKSFWIVTSPFLDNKKTAFQILAQFLTNEKYHESRVSFMLENELGECLPGAFQLGLLSCHFMPFSLESLSKELESLLAQLKGDTTNGTWTSSEYFRNYLMTHHDYERLIQLSKKLMQMYPMEHQFVTYLAEAQQLAGQEEEAQETLDQAKFLGIGNAPVNSEDTVNQENQLPEEDIKQFAKLFKFENVAIVDSDSMSNTTLKELLAELGFQEVEFFEDGEAAWKALKDDEKKVDLLIQEWRIPKLSGSALLQRVRQVGRLELPVVIYSSLTRRQDSHLLRELGVSTVIEKPTTREEFLKHMLEFIREEKYAPTSKALERQIYFALSNKDTLQARALREKFLLLEERAEATEDSVNAAFDFYDGKYDEAKKNAFSSIRKSGENILILNLLGKIFFKMGAMEEAIKCFHKATELSAGNLERLCLLAEANNAIGNAQGVVEAVTAAENVDKENPAVQATKANIEISKGNTEKAKQIIAKLEDLSPIVSYTNNYAVLLAKTGKLEKSRAMYEQANASLPADAYRFRSVILYNLAMSYARSADAATTVKVLSQINVNKLGPEDQTLIQKTKSLENKATESIRSNKPLALNYASTPDEREVKSKLKENPCIGFDIPPGTICSNRILPVSDPQEEENLKKYLNMIT